MKTESRFKVQGSREVQGSRFRVPAPRRRGYRRLSSRADADLNAWFLKLDVSTQGGALVMVLIIICVLSVVATSMLLTTTSRYHTTYQSASWQEAIVSAEAGIDLAMNELRKRVVGGPGNAFLTQDAAVKNGQTMTAYWTVNAPDGTAYKNYGHAFPASNQPYLFPGVDNAGNPSTTQTHGGEGNTAMQARVYIDVPGSDSATTPGNFAVASTTDNNSYISQFDNPALRDPDGVNRSRWWYRVRALGIANVSGPTRPNLEKLDTRLRRFSLFTDWRTGEAVASPQVARMVEVLVQPRMNFRNALMADKQINLNSQDVLIDSYDSSKGYYSALNVGNQGNIATNGQLINASHATVNGNALTNNGTINDGDKVTGQQSGNFYQELTPFTAGLLNPTWSGVKDDGTLVTDTSYTASNDATNPTLVHIDGINLPDGNHVINLASPATSTAGTPAYIKLYVQGDISTLGTSYINVGADVNAIIYFTGNINLQGNGIINNSFLARNLVLNGLRPPANKDGSFPTRTVKVATSQDFEGIIYAPDHDLTLALTAVPPGGTGSLTPVVKPIIDPKTQKKIDDLNEQINKDNKDIASAQADYAKNMANYAQTGNQSSYTNAQQDLTKVASLQGLIAGLQAQITALTTGTPPSSVTDDHARGYNGIYGGFVSKTITIGSKTHVHYDETLRTAGPVNHYEIVNWFEDSISRSTMGGSTAFWWAGAK